MEIKYRRANCGDASALATLRWQARVQDEKPGVTPGQFLAAYQRYLDDGLRSAERLHWVAEMDGHIVAVIVVQRVDLVPRPCKLGDAMGIITDFFTLPEYRHRGIGGSLLGKAVGWARDNDFELLAVWSSDEAAVWYQRRGFALASDVLQQSLRAYYDPAWGQ